MPTEKESLKVNYLPNISHFFKIMGFPKPSSFMTKEFLGPCCPDKNTLKDLQHGNRDTYKSTIRRIERCFNQYLESNGIQPIKLDAQHDIELTLEQQEWKSYLWGLFYTEWNKTFKKTFTVMHTYLMADINQLGKNAPVSEIPILEFLTILMIFAAYEHDYHRLLTLKEPNSIITDILPKQDGEKTLWPMKLLFDSWRREYKFKNKLVCYLEKEKISKSDNEDDVQHYAIRTINDWIAGSTPPNNEQRISKKTTSWIKEVCGSEEVAKREWLRFVMACKLQGLLKNKPDSLPYIYQMYEKLFEEITTIS